MIVGWIVNNDDVWARHILHIATVLASLQSIFSCCSWSCVMVDELAGVTSGCGSVVSVKVEGLLVGCGSGLLMKVRGWLVSCGSVLSGNSVDWVVGVGLGDKGKRMEFWMSDMEEECEILPSNADIRAIIVCSLER